MSSFVSVFGSDSGDARDLLSRRTRTDWWTANRGVKKGDYVWLYINAQGAKEIGGPAGFYAIYRAQSKAEPSDVLRRAGVDVPERKYWLEIIIDPFSDNLVYLGRPISMSDLRADDVLKDWQFTRTSGGSASNTSPLSGRDEYSLVKLARSRIDPSTANSFFR